MKIQWILVFELAGTGTGPVLIPTCFSTGQLLSSSYGDQYL